LCPEKLDHLTLYRLANFKEYGFDRDDIKLLTDYVHENQYRFPGALKRIAEVKGFSANGREKLSLLAEHFKDFHMNNSAWQVLSQYLFVKSDYLRFLAADTSVRGKQKRLAIYQLMLLAHQLREEFNDPDSDPKRQFLDYVRHLRIVGEDKQLRQTPGWADDINAVRLLTIHAAKGLEWSAVHLPTLSNGKFPKSKQPDKSLLSKTKSPEKSADWQDEEEDCLFFVALSRARDYLRLYRARQYDFKEKQPSRLLKFIEGELPHATCKLPERVPPPVRMIPAKRTVEVKREYIEHRLEIYHQCPLEYEHRYVLGITSPRSEMPISKTRLCVYQVGEAIKNEQKAGRVVTLEFAKRKLVEAWSQTGPATHPYETEYRVEAEKMIKTIVESHPNNEARIFQPDWRVELENGIVIVRPDFVDLVEEDGKMKVIVEKLNFGSMPEKTPQDDLYALLDIAAEQTYPELKRQIKVSYMTDEQSMVLTINSNWRRNSVKNYEKAIDGVLNEDFNPKVDKDHCPFCSYYMMCSSNDEPIV
jgi:DNA helicase-2/ATP-dependent DNA helicase PcrA